MKFIRLVVVIVVVALLTAVLPVLAQSDQATPVTFRDGVTATYPEGWEVTTDDDDVLLLTTDTMGLYMFLYSLADLDSVQIEPGDTLATLEYYHNQNMAEGSDPFDAAQVQTVTINEREIVYFEPVIGATEQERYQTLRGAMVLDETGRIVTFGAFPLEAAEVSGADEILEIVASAETGIYYLGDGSSFTYPPAWDSYVDDDGYIRLVTADSNLRMEFLSPETLSDMKATAEDLVPVAEYGFESVNDKDLTFDPAAVSSITVGEFPGVAYQITDTYEGEQYERLFLAALLPDGWVTLFDLVPNVDATINPDDLDAVLASLASFTVPGE